MQNFLSAAKEIFFPRRCFFCKKYQTFLCPDCAALLEIGPEHRPDYSKECVSDIYAACSYENKRVKNLIRALKYEPFSRQLAAPLALVIAGHFSLAAPNFDLGGFIIAPAPLSKKRLRERGYNQSESIGFELANIWQIPIAAGALEKIRDTAPQAELNRSQRLQNLKNAFAADRALVENKKILLLDDVTTTGATMEECGRALRHAGAKQIIGVCVARTEN